jgi:hypothetical protein
MPSPDWRPRLARETASKSIRVLVASAVAALATLAWAAPALAASSDVITTAAGTATAGYTGDSGPATAAELSGPEDVAPLPSGGYLIADTLNNVVRKVDPSGDISTVAGTGTSGYTGDSGPATAAELSQPQGVAPVTDTSFYIADSSNSVIRFVNGSGIIHTVAGNGTSGFGGDGGAATSAMLALPTGVESLGGGSFLIADSNNDRIREVSSGTMFTDVGTGTRGFSGDTGLATSAKLALPRSVEIDGSPANVLIADSCNNRIRTFPLSPFGTIDTIAGSGAAGPFPLCFPPSGSYGGDGGPPTSAKLQQPGDISPTPDGGYLIADTLNSAIRKVNAAGTDIETVAGTGVAGYTGDGGLATSGTLSDPYGVASLPDGTFLIADTDNNVVRKVGPGFPPASGTPKAGKTAFADPVEGDVLVKAPGSSDFVPLTEDSKIPIGSLVDTTNGTVKLVTGTGKGSKTQHADFWAGLFKLTQAKHKALVTLTLKGPPPTCKASALESAKRHSHKRLYGNGHGHYRTKGHHSAGTVNGTKWLTEELCTGTLTKVFRGSVSVLDFTKHKTFIVKAGHQYLAKGPP